MYIIDFQKKLRCDVDKAKRDRDDVVKLKELSDVRLVSLEQNLLDLNGIVERCQRDIDKSQQKKDRLVEENQALQIQIEKMQKACNDLGLEDPVKISAQITSYQ